MNTRTVAREWLYFLVFFALGIILEFLILSQVFSPYNYSGIPRKIPVIQLVIQSLVQSDHKFFTWLIVLSPYMGFQLIRSIRWSIHRLQTKNGI